MTSLNTFIQNNPLPTAGNNVPPNTTQKVGGFLQNNIVNPVKQAFSGAIGQIGQGASQIMSGQGNPIVQGVEGALKVGSGLAGIPGSLLAPVVQPAMNAVSNNPLTDNPTVQKFAMSPAGQTTARVAEDFSNAGNVAGGILGAEGVKNISSNIWDRAYNGNPGGVDFATQSLENQSRSAVNAQQSIDSSVGNFKTGLGQAFGEAPKQIEQLNPGARATLPSDIMDRLNALKDTKKFALPDYLRTTSQEFGGNLSLSDIEKGGVSLTPTEMQDLVTRINKLTYAAKASGDLEVNQSTIGLNKDLHSVATDAFGNVKDASGNSIWGKAYENYSKGINAVDKISDIFNSDKVTTPSDFNKTMDTIKNLSKDPQGKIILKNAIDEFKQTSGIDLTNPTAEISKILGSEEFLKESQKPSFLAKTFDKTYQSRLVTRIIEYAVFGTIIRGIIKNANQ